MVGRYEVSDLDVEDILVFAPNAHVDLGYTPYPSQFELEQEILAGIHTNPHGEIGCPVCGCIDLFLKERTAKGVRYRCMSCMYATESEFESVKSRKDITLAQFGLGFECAICGEDIDSYNHDTVMRHVRKCRQNQNQNFEAPYQPSQTLADYSPEMLKYSSAVTGDFFWDSLKFGQTTRNAETAEDSLKVYRRMSWEQYLDALDTGYLMPTEMRMKLDGFVSNKSWSVSDRFNTSRTPLFDSPLAHLQADVLPIFEIELLPEDKLQPTFEKAKNGRLPIIDVLSAIPVERVTPFSTSEQVSSLMPKTTTILLMESSKPKSVDDSKRKLRNRQLWEQRRVNGRLVNHKNLSVNMRQRVSEQV